MPGRPDNNLAQNARVHAQAGRTSSWARSRPCVVVGAEPAVRRRGRRAGRASSWAKSRPCGAPAGLLDLRRRCAAARRGVRGIRGVLRRASGAQFLIARRGRRSGRRSTASTTARSRVPRRAARRPSTASRRTSPRRPRAVLLRCSAFLHQVGITCSGGGCGVLPPRRLRGQPLTGWPRWRSCSTRSWPWGSPTSDASKTRMIRDPYSSCL